MTKCDFDSCENDVWLKFSGGDLCKKHSAEIVLMFYKEKSEALESRVKALEEENENIMSIMLNDMVDVCEYKNLDERLAIAVEALEFYSSPGAWGTDLPGMNTSIDPTDQERLGNFHTSIRGGKTAREALKKIKDME